MAYKMRSWLMVQLELNEYRWFRCICFATGIGQSGNDYKLVEAPKREVRVSERPGKRLVRVTAEIKK